MRHVFTVVGAGMAAMFVVVFFTGRLDSKHMTAVAPRVGVHPDALTAMVPRIASQTGATIGTSRRVVYLLACSGGVNAQNMESKALEAAALTEKRRVTAREAAVAVLVADAAPSGRAGHLKDC